jgi:hypothetical protein
MKKALLAAVAAGTLALGAAGSASAAQYITKLEYDASGLHVPEFGTVTVTELDANTVNVLVDFNDEIDKIVDTGSAHVAFAFSLVDSPDSTVSILQPNPNTGANKYVYQPQGTYTQSPFGTFTNALTCCGKGSSNGQLPPLEFNVLNSSGITFQGAGNHFVSNTTGTVGGYTGGWWFAVDIYNDEAPGDGTFTVAGRDFCTVGANCGGTDQGVPEPATWALMIMGFGGAGAMLRRRRTVVA